MNLFGILGLLLVTSLLVSAILLGSPLIIFFNTVSVIIIVLGTLSVTMAAHGIDGVLKYLLGGMSRLLLPANATPWSAQECTQAVHVARSAGTSAILLAGCGGLIGVIQMLQQMDDPTKIGPAMAVALLTSFYAVLGNLLIFIPLARYFSEAALKVEG
jgi:flagellar motor component MotA